MQQRRCERWAGSQTTTLGQNAKRGAKVTVSCFINHSARKEKDDVTDILYTTQSQANQIQYTGLYANMGTHKRENSSPEVCESSCLFAVRVLP